MDELDLYQQLYEKEKALENIFGGTKFLEDISANLFKLIMQKYHISDDTPDVVVDAMVDFEDGRIAKDELIKVLNQFAKSDVVGD